MFIYIILIVDLYAKLYQRFSRNRERRRLFSLSY